MLGQMRRLAADDTGAVTVDYVVLAGAVVALGVVTAGAIQSGAFAAITDAMKLVSEEQGCVQTGEEGTTDLTNCN